MEWNELEYRWNLLGQEGSEAAGRGAWTLHRARPPAVGGKGAPGRGAPRASLGRPAEGLARRAQAAEPLGELAGVSRDLWLGELGDAGKVGVGCFGGAAGRVLHLHLRPTPAQPDGATLGEAERRRPGLPEHQTF